MAYKFNYSRVGDITRVNIATADDIRNLGELDKKMWTVLSCPVKGLEIDEQSLKYMDTNNDGAIHVDEVIAVSQWLSNVLKDMTPVMEGKEALALNNLNTANEEGAKLKEAAEKILKEVGKENEAVISLADSSSSLATFLKNKLEAAQAAIDKENAVAAPYGDQTDAIDAAYQALDAKVKDFFMRAKLSSFSKESTAALDVQVSSIEAIATDNLTDKMAEIANYPIARIEEGKQTIALDGSINPAWAGQFATVKGAFGDEKELTEEMWAEVGAKIQAYKDYQKSITITEADIVLDEETASIQLVDKLLHLTRDFYTLLNNYVTLKDFYNPKEKAIFQAGTLIIDQRACDLCVAVADAGALAAQAGNSNLYLLTLDCIQRATGKTVKIAAAVTMGSVSDLYVGKNAIFYDRAGLDYDAKVVSIIDNPISIKQAMWSPYIKFGKFVETQINKFASEKESGVMSDATSKFSEATAAAPAAPAEGAAAAPKPSFDMAKFCGIFAMITLAVSALVGVLAAIVAGFAALPWYGKILALLGIFLLISGPSMFIAWMKLRKRDLGPVLNANGWAINAGAKINIPFGQTLTQMAKFPFVKGKDPFAQKTSTGKKILYWIIGIIIVLGIIAFAGYRFGASLTTIGL